MYLSLTQILEAHTPYTDPHPKSDPWYCQLEGTPSSKAPPDALASFSQPDVQRLLFLLRASLSSNAHTDTSNAQNFQEARDLKHLEE